MRRIARRDKPEPTIALINVVFLMLIFFLVAGTVAQPMDQTLNLVRTSDLEGREPPDAVVIHADGRLSYRGEPLADVANFVASRANPELREVRIVPDRSVDATRLVEVARLLRGAGAQSVIIVTERAVP